MRPRNRTATARPLARAERGALEGAGEGGLSPFVPCKRRLRDARQAAAHGAPAHARPLGLSKAPGFHGKGTWSKSWGFHVTKRAAACDPRGMPSYLVESYLCNCAAVIEDACGRARRAAEPGPGVRHLRTTFIPGDETVLHLFEAPSAEALDRAGRLAALPYQRIVEAVEAAAETRKEER
jgi:hypothetical protein